VESASNLTFSGASHLLCPWATPTTFGITVRDVLGWRLGAHESIGKHLWVALALLEPCWYGQSKNVVPSWHRYLEMKARPQWLEYATFSVSWSYTQSVWLLGRGSTRRKASAYAQNNTNTEWKHTVQTSMPWVGFEPTIPAFERAKPVNGLDCAATVIDSLF
jgi:hypothetical protein